MEQQEYIHDRFYGGELHNTSLPEEVSAITFITAHNREVLGYRPFSMNVDGSIILFYSVENANLVLVKMMIEDLKHRHSMPFQQAAQWILCSSWVPVA